MWFVVCVVIMLRVIVFCRRCVGSFVLFCVCCMVLFGWCVVWSVVIFGGSCILYWLYEVCVLWVVCFWFCRLGVCFCSLVG